MVPSWMNVDGLDGVAASGRAQDAIIRPTSTLVFGESLYNLEVTEHTTRILRQALMG